MNNTVENTTSSYRSLISLVIIIGSLFSLAFLQMEERRQSYHVLKLNRELKKTMETRRSLEVKRLNALRPQKIEKEIQTRTALNHASSEQIIHLPSIPVSTSVSSNEADGQGTRL